MAKEVDLINIPFLRKKLESTNWSLSYRPCLNDQPLVFGARVGNEGGRGLNGGEAGQSLGRMSNPFSDTFFPYKGCFKGTSLGSCY